MQFTSGDLGFKVAWNNTEDMSNDIFFIRRGAEAQWEACLEELAHITNLCRSVDDSGDYWEDKWVE